MNNHSQKLCCESCRETTHSTLPHNKAPKGLATCDCHKVDKKCTCKLPVIESNMVEAHCVKCKLPLFPYPDTTEGWEDAFEHFFPDPTGRYLFPAQMKHIKGFIRTHKEMFEYDARTAALSACLNEIENMKAKKHFNFRYSKEEICPHDGFCPQCQKDDAYNTALTILHAKITSLMEGQHD